MDEGITREERVLEVARRQLGEVGPASLSLRAIAREIGVVPSALYRYYSGRDAILTGLITTGYDRLGESVEQAEGTCSREALLDRWIATWVATRTWAVSHPHEYALLYGTPVVGYVAPPETAGPATRVVVTLARIALGSADFMASETTVHRPPGAATRADADRIRASLPSLGLPAAPDAPDQAVLGTIEAWTTLFGAVSFELFGHYVGSIQNPAEHLVYLAHTTASRLGIRNAD
ncbi:MAG: TetR/AcrR family transcriptional regulator [Arachnia sp.]